MTQTTINDAGLYPDDSAQVAHCITHLQKKTGCTLEDIFVVRAPLRISPLGAHVDHQDGLVTGMTLDRAIILAFTPRAERTVTVHSFNFPGTVHFGLDDIPAKIQGDWGNYARGAATALQAKYELRSGMEAVVSGTMPIGGLSSSAAVGVAYLLALEYVNGLTITAEENIQLDRSIENHYLGLQNGVLDQSIILLSRQDHLTYLDCLTMEVELVPANSTCEAHEFLVVYSGVDKALVGTDYNLRVSQCAEAAQRLMEAAGQPVPPVPRLRQVPEEVYNLYHEVLPEPLMKRARHFFTEVNRVRQGVDAWRDGDITSVGKLINASGASSIHNYESGCEQLRTLYDILSVCSGVYGVRFSGGGFRGSCIGLSHPEYREHITETIEKFYPKAHPEMKDSYNVYFCRSDGPARVQDGDFVTTLMG